MTGLQLLFNDVLEFENFSSERANQLFNAKKQAIGLEFIITEKMIKAKKITTSLDIFHF